MQSLRMTDVFARPAHSFRFGSALMPDSAAFGQSAPYAHYHAPATDHLPTHALDDLRTFAESPPNSRSACSRTRPSVNIAADSGSACQSHIKRGRTSRRAASGHDHAGTARHPCREPVHARSDVTVMHRTANQLATAQGDQRCWHGSVASQERQRPTRESPRSQRTVEGRDCASSSLRSR